jgi:hypothetical protein
MFSKFICLFIFSLFSQFCIFAEDAYSEFDLYLDIGALYYHPYVNGTIKGERSEYNGQQISTEINAYGAFLNATSKYFKMGMFTAIGNDPSEPYPYARGNSGFSFDWGFNAALRYPFGNKFFEIAPFAGASWTLNDIKAIYLEGGISLYLKWLFVEGSYQYRIGGDWEFEPFNTNPNREYPVLTNDSRYGLIHGFAVRIGVSFAIFFTGRTIRTNYVDENGRVVNSTTGEETNLILRGT